LSVSCSCASSLSGFVLPLLVVLPISPSQPLKMIRFPYTTLFRSPADDDGHGDDPAVHGEHVLQAVGELLRQRQPGILGPVGIRWKRGEAAFRGLLCHRLNSP